MEAKSYLKQAVFNCNLFWLMRDKGKLGLDIGEFEPVSENPENFSS